MYKKEWEMAKPTLCIWSLFLTYLLIIKKNIDSWITKNELARLATDQFTTWIEMLLCFNLSSIVKLNYEGLL